MKPARLISGLVFGGLLTLSAYGNVASAADLIGDIVKKGVLTVGVGVLRPDSNVRLERRDGWKRCRCRQ